MRERECLLIEDGGTFRCEACGWASSKRARRMCPKRADRPLPTFIQRVARFAAAAAKNALEGFPMRTENEIKAILESHCQPCPEFTGYECRLCGCKTNDKRRLLNKLAMATEHCPLEKW